MKPVPVFHGVDRTRFEADIVPAGRLAVLKGLVADWPIVKAAATSDEALAAYIAGFDNGRPVRTFVGSPEMGGRFGYSPDLKGFNHEQMTAPLAELLKRLLAGRGDPRTPHIYAEIGRAHV